MAKSQQSFGKKEVESKKRKKAKEKAEKREQRKQERAESGKKSLEDLMMYLDEDGNLTSVPPDPSRKKKEIKAEDIVVGIPRQEHIPEEIVRKGTVKFFNDEKGYGFIVDAANGNSLFVHTSNVEAEYITDGDKVIFEIEQADKGPTAVKVKLDK